MSMAGIGPVAPVSRRAIAYLIDGAIAGVITGIAYFPLAGAALGAVSADLASALASMAMGLLVVSVVTLGWFVAYTVMQGGGGSIGMRIMKLRLVREDAVTPLGFGRALVRNLVFGVTAAIIVGYFTPLFDGSGRFQGWHDKAGGALMRDVRDAAAPAPHVVATTPGASVPSLATPLAATPVAAPMIPPRPPMPPAPAAAAPGVPASPAVPAGPAPAAPAPAPAPDALIDAVPGITVTSPPIAPAPAPAAAALGAPTPAAPVPAPAAPVPAPAAPVPAPAAPAAPLFEPSIGDDDIESTRISIPGHRLVFIWDDGVRVRVSRRTVFGRNPAQEEGATVVAVRDETLSLSKTHFEAAAESSGAWVLDRYSTNGVTIVRDGTRIACPPGTRVPVRIGDALEIGDRIVTVGGYE